MSAGTPNPTTCPRWRGPLAYGHAGATRIFCFVVSCSGNVRFLLDGGAVLDHTSRPPAHSTAHGECGTNEDPDESEGDEDRDGPRPGGSVARRRGFRRRH